MDRRGFLATIGSGTTAAIAGCFDNGTTWADDNDRLLAADVLEAHRRELTEARSFILFSTAETDHEGDEQPSGWLYTQTYESAFELERERQYLKQDLTEIDETIEAYVGDGDQFVRERIGESVSYERHSFDRSEAQFRDVGELTVPEPAWIGEALERTGD